MDWAYKSPQATEWSVLQAAANKLLEHGIKREWELTAKRTIKRRQNLKQLILRERRQNEEDKLIMLVQ